MRLLLAEVADFDRRWRLINGVGMVGVGATLGVVGTVGALGTKNTDERIIDWAAAGVGTWVALVGGWTLLSRSDGEILHDYFNDGLRLYPNDARVIVVRSEQRLRSIAQSDRGHRIVDSVIFGIVTGIGATTVVRAAAGGPPIENPYLFWAIFIPSAAALTNSFIPTVRERVWHLWSEDPGIQRVVVQPTLSLVSGGGYFGISGRF